MNLPSYAHVYLIFFTERNAAKASNLFWASAFLKVRKNECLSCGFVMILENLTSCLIRSSVP